MKRDNVPAVIVTGQLLATVLTLAGVYHFASDARRESASASNPDDALGVSTRSQGSPIADSYDDVNFTPPLLATITADTLIVFGDRDPLYPVSLAFELYAAIPKAHLWVVPNGGHGPVFGNAAPRFAETALSFVRGEWNK